MPDIQGTNGDDSLIGDAYDNVFGYEGDDTLIADDESNPDLIHGVFVYGGIGSDYYIVKDRTALVITEENNSSDIDVVDLSYLVDDINDVRFSGDLYITIYNGNRKATAYVDIKGQFGESAGSVEKLIIGDNTYDLRSSYLDDIGVDSGEKLNSVLVYGASDEADVIQGTHGGRESIYGLAGDDTIYAQTNTNRDIVGRGVLSQRLYGGEGNDYLATNVHSDYLYGEEGNDFLVAGVMAYGGEGNDTLQAGAGDTNNALFDTNTLFGEGGDDTYIIGVGFNRVFVREQQNGGTDVIDLSQIGVSSSDLLFEYVSRSPAVKLYTDEYNFGVYLVDQFSPVSGAGIETIILSNGEYDVSYAMSLEELISIIHYGSTLSSDVINASSSDNHIFGFSGDDQIFGNEGNDTLIGGDGRDTINAGAGNDYIWAGAGDEGADYFEGGSGDDRIGGGAGSDSLYGDGGADIIYGGTGNDVIYGGDGDDAIFHGQGDDRIDAGSGNDVVWGGKTDIHADEVLGNAGNDKLGAGGGDDTLRGGSGDDSLFGAGGQDIVLGGSGNDVLYGGGGSDTITGEAGNDEIYNGGGEDIVDGGQGLDILWAGSGDDTLTGGAGGDSFMFSGGFGNDVITDFTVTGSESDNLDFTEITSVTLAGLQSNAVMQGDNLVLTIGSDKITLIGLSLEDLQTAIDNELIITAA